MLLTVPVAAAKVALLWPDRTATLAGTESNPLSLVNATVAKLVVALFNVTVQVVEALLPKAAGVHASEVSCAGVFPVAVSVNVRETLFKEAVSKAVWLETTAATVAVNVALLSPAPILTLPGTVTLVLLLSNVMLTALAEVAVNVTVQVEVPGELTVPGAQFKLLSWVAAARLITACWVTPLRVAVTVAF